jgi:hypothetical protein
MLEHPPAARIISGVFGFAFLGIGLMTLITLWGAPFGGFHSPPLVFRIFGSFIALVFTVAGGTIAWTAVTSRSALGGLPPIPSSPPNRGGRVDYTCPKCSAPLTDKADVSPHGDVKCSHCNSWFNIHAR